MHCIVDPESRGDRRCEDKTQIVPAATEADVAAEHSSNAATTTSARFMAAELSLQLQQIRVRRILTALGVRKRSSMSLRWRRTGSQLGCTCAGLVACALRDLKLRNLSRAPAL